MQRVIDYLIIGGGLAGVSAAKQLESLKPNAKVLIASEEAHVPYNRPPLSKRFLTTGMLASELAYDGLETLRAERVLDSRVAHVDCEKRIASTEDGRTFQFDKCLLSTGGRPRRLSVAGEQLPQVYQMRTVDDASTLRREMAPGKRCVIVGAGFIGLELANTLSDLGMSVQVVEMADAVWPQFKDSTVSRIVQDYAEARGVRIHLNSRVTAFGGQSSLESIILSTGQCIECDIAVVCAGIIPNVELAVTAGLEVNNGIVVDQSFRTSHSSIFAAGDVCTFPDPRSVSLRRIEHWGHAEHSGYVAARNMAGFETTYSLMNYVWSEMSDLRFDYAGYHLDADYRVQRRLSDINQYVLYLRDRRLIAYSAFNAPQRELAVLNRLIRQKSLVEAALLSDPALELRSCLR